MCVGLAMIRSEIPDCLFDQYQLDKQQVTRFENAESEVQFLWRTQKPHLPVWLDGQLQIYQWGARDRHCSLPKCRDICSEEVKSGRWSQGRTVEIPVNLALENGVWYQVIEGFKAFLLYDEQRIGHVYLLTQPATHYYEVMTRAQRMPVFIGRGI